MNIFMSRDNDGKLVFEKAGIKLPFDSFEITRNSSFENPVKLLLHSQGIQIEVTMDEKDFIEFVFEWMRYNFNFLTPNSTPSQFLSTVKQMLKKSVTKAGVQG